MRKSAADTIALPREVERLTAELTGLKREVKVRHARRDRETERQRERQRERETETERETERQRERDRDRETETETDRDKQRREALHFSSVFFLSLLAVVLPSFLFSSSMAIICRSHLPFPSFLLSFPCLP